MQTFIIAENARRSRESPTATALYLDPVNPIYWTQYPFIINQLSSYDDFLAALNARFGDLEYANAEDDTPYGSARGGESDESQATLSIRAHPFVLS